MDSKIKVFVDGREGTTGLRIIERLAGRSDVEMLEISDELRKDSAERARFINAADVVFLCLPDDAAREAVALCENSDTVIIDASTAHRTADGWAYGLPELRAGQRDLIKKSKRISVPGCYATGFILLTYPLVAAGVIPVDYPVVCHAVSGYSGAGKKAIAQYNAEDRDVSLDGPRMYALTGSHKHLPEMKKYSELAYEPVFNPYVCDYYAGMTVNVPLHTRLLGAGASLDAILAFYEEHYNGEPFVRVMGSDGGEAVKNGFIDPITTAGCDYAQIIVTGNDERVTLTARFDNLGKGASGAAVQCFNLVAGLPETTGLCV